MKNLSYFGIEWRAHNYLNISKEQTEKTINILDSLDENDDIQNVFVNCNISL